MSNAIKSKKLMNFKSLDSLDPVQKVIKEAGDAINDKTKTINTSAISEVLSGALGAGVGGVASFAALFYGGSVVGLSAAGITSGLATAGALVGGGMTAGIAVLAAPVAGLAAIGVGIASHRKTKKLIDYKLAVYNQAVSKQNAIIKTLAEEKDSDKERIDYLTSLNIALSSAIKDLKEDLGLRS